LAAEAADAGAERAGAAVAVTVAARLWGAADALRESLGAPLPPHERDEAVREREGLRQALGEEAFAAAFAEGRAMNWERAIAYALEEMGEEAPPQQQQER
jgi:hypothetical protein